MKTKDFNYIFKCVIIGDCHVGKTTLLRRLLGEPFLPKPAPERHSPISQQHLQCVDKIFTTPEGIRVKLQIYDTMGLERHRSLTLSYYRDAHCCLICYNVHNPQSFSDLHYWLEDLHKYLGKDTNLIKMLVGINSRDPVSVPENGHISGEHSDFIDVEPTTKEPTGLAQEHNAQTCEVKLYDKQDVESCFQTVVDCLMKDVKDKNARIIELSQNGTVQLNKENPPKSYCC